MFSRFGGVLRMLANDAAKAACRYPLFVAALVIALLPAATCNANEKWPAPQLAEGKSADWWFVFKFNAKSFPGCGSDTERTCPFGGKVQHYKQFGEQYVYA